MDQGFPTVRPQARLTIIVPTFNEAENISLLIWLLKKSLGPSAASQVPVSRGTPGEQRQEGEADARLWWEVVVVDDASSDGTAEVVRGLVQAGQQGLGLNIKLVERPSKLGLGTAYMAGLQHASGDWVVLMDADLSHHPRYIPQFLDKQAATGCDIVTGTRYARGGGVAGWSWARKLTSRGANLLASTLLGTSTSDLTGAYRLYRREALAKLLSSCTCRGYAFQMEVAARAQAAGLSIAEVPIVFVDRLYGTSKLGPGEFAGFLAGLARLLLAL